MSQGSQLPSRPIQSEGFLIAQMPQPAGVTRTRYVYSESGSLLRGPTYNSGQGHMGIPEGEALRTAASTFNLAHAHSLALRVYLDDGTIRPYIVIRQKFGGAFPYGTDSVLGALGSPISFSITYGRITNYFVPTHRSGMIQVVTDYAGMDYNGALDDDFEELQAVAAHTVDRVYTQVYHEWLDIQTAIQRGGDMYHGSYDQYGVTLPPDPRTQNPPRFQRWK